MPVKPTHAPAERSMPFPIRQKNMPTATIDTIDTCLSTFVMFEILKKLSTNTLKIRNSANSTNSML